MSGPVLELPASCVDFLESGVSLLVATTDATGLPEPVRGAGVIVSPDRRGFTVLVPSTTGERTRANLEAGSRIAVTFSRPIDYRGVQLKGRCVSVRDATPAEHEVARSYRIAFVEATHLIGMARSLSGRLRVEPCFAVDVEVHESFDQTPGPKAGEPGAPGAVR